MSNRDSFILKLMREKGFTLEDAEAFVEDLDIPEQPPVIVDMDGRPMGPQPVVNTGLPWRAGDSAQVRAGNEKVAPRFSVASKGADGLDAVQAAGLARGVPLCPNCQHPEDEHVPGCIRDPKNGYRPDERARVKTTAPLPAST